MDSDEATLLRIKNFTGSVPISIVLSRSDEGVFRVQSPDLYLQLPRFGYLSAYADRIFGYFQRQLRQTCSRKDIWFTDKTSGATIRHNYPIGALYDLHHKSTCPTSPLWSITSHFQNFPREELVQHFNTELVELSYMYAVKEADAIVHNGQVIQSMSRKDHETLWASLCEGDFDKFNRVNQLLTRAPVQAIPIRVHMLNDKILQRLIPCHVKNEENRESLVSDVLKEFKVRSVILNGIAVDSDTPLVWIFQHLAFADNFLHFVECR